MKQIAGIFLKKKFGQHFLRDETFTRIMLDAVSINNTTNVLEIGCGDGFLTKAILRTQVARLWSFDIDPEWIAYVRKTVSDNRLQLFHENILDVDFATRFAEHQPWIVLANLPYQITFPLLYRVMQHRQLFSEGVVMVQEEVAQKIVKTGGRGFGFPSLYLQYYATWKLLNKVPPQAFFPLPKIYSRLLYFKPKQSLAAIPAEEQFWKFIKACFRQPRRTLKNNLQQTSINLEAISPDILQLRAQQMKFEDLLTLWHQIV